jgi:hypothetical protein
VALEADEHEGRGGRKPAGLAAVLFAGHDGGEPAPSALESDDVHAGVHGELGIGSHPLLKDGRGGEAGAGQDPDPVGELGQVQPLLQGGVAASDDDDLVGAPVERPVAGGAEVDAGADEILLAGTPRRR